LKLAMIRIDLNNEKKLLKNNNPTIQTGKYSVVIGGNF